MTAATITLDVQDIDIDAPLAVLRAIERRAVDLSDVLDEIGLALTSSTRLRFERGVGPDGLPWLPSLRALEQDGQTLVDTARLRDSITHAVGGDSVEVGTNVVYAGIHQFGGDIAMPERTQTLYRRLDDLAEAGRAAPFVKRRHATVATEHTVAAHTVTMPARPFLGIDADDQAEILAIIGDALRQAGAAP